MPRWSGAAASPLRLHCATPSASGACCQHLCRLRNKGRSRGRPPRPEGRGFHAPGWLRCGPCGATPFPPRPERRGSSGVLDGHLNNLLLDLRCLTCVGIFQEKRTPTPQEILPAPVALLAFRRRAMSHDIRALAVGTVEHLRDHCGSLSHRWFCSAQTPIKDSRSTDLKHLRPT